MGRKKANEKERNYRQSNDRPLGEVTRKKVSKEKLNAFTSRHSQSRQSALIAVADPPG